MAGRSSAEFDRLVADATTHHESGRLDEAEATYRVALAMAPGHPAITHNLGVVAAAQGRHPFAIDLFDAAIVAEPRYAAAHYNRAVALHALGRSREAIASFSRASAIEPGMYEAHRALGFLCLAEHERGRALDHFARTYELRRGEDRSGIAEKSLHHASPDKLRHDAEQFRFLAARRRGAKRFEMLARAYEQVAAGLPEGAAHLSASQLEMLGGDYNTAIDVREAPEVMPRAVESALDAGAIARRFEEHASGVTWFDGLLTPPALAGIRRYLLESTIWHDFDHIGGFVAAYLEDGLACPLLLQIVDEIRTAFQGLVGQCPLTQAWAFKGLGSGAAVDMHADDAAVSVNFWVTPNEANLEPGRGGLVVCRTPPPADWQVSGYDDDKARIGAFLAQHAGDNLVVPYRENRAVLFESRLFHWSDAPKFAAGYENHRINLTLLFGRQGA